jgi:cytochrome c-type biogenesis protein CcsB
MPDRSLAHLSDVLFWVTLVVYSVAMVGYLAHLAYRSVIAGRVATVIMWAGVAAHASSVAARGFSAHRVPWGNMYEYSMMLGLLIALVFLLVIDARLHLRAIGGFVVGAGVLALVSARFVYAPAGPLVPALNSPWLKIHVIAAISGSTLYAVSFIFTLLYFVKKRAEKRAGTTFAGSGITGSTVGAAYVGTDRPVVSDLDTEENTVPAEQKGVLARLPSSARFDELAFRTVQFSFPIWTFAVMAGAIWAHEAWGRYWGWDPKETWAFITWVVYAGYLHARSTAGWRGARSGAINVAGFVCVVFNYYAVNLWISGLHSYAK